MQLEFHCLNGIDNLFRTLSPKQCDVDTWLRQCPSDHELCDGAIKFVGDEAKLIQDILCLFPRLALIDGVG